MEENCLSDKQEKLSRRPNICTVINITLLSFLIASIGFNIWILTTDSYWSCDLVKSDGNKAHHIAGPSGPQERIHTLKKRHASGWWARSWQSNTQPIITTTTSTTIAPPICPSCPCSCPRPLPPGCALVTRCVNTPPEQPTQPDEGLQTKPGDCFTTSIAGTCCGNSQLTASMDALTQPNISLSASKESRKEHSMFYRKMIPILSMGLIACLSMIGVIFLMDGGAIGLCSGGAGLGLNGDQGVSVFEKKTKTRKRRSSSSIERQRLIKLCQNIPDDWVTDIPLAIIPGCEIVTAVRTCCGNNPRLQCRCVTD